MKILRLPMRHSTSGERLKKHEELKETHNSLLAQEVKGKMSMGVECNILNISPCATNPSCSTSTNLALVRICRVILYYWKMNL
jgi:hypothetical protein